MRKRLKKKRHSCSLCKPHKMGQANRWKAKDLQAERDARDQIRKAREVR